MANVNNDTGTTPSVNGNGNCQISVKYFYIRNSDTDNRATVPVLAYRMSLAANFKLRLECRATEVFQPC